MKLNNVFIEKLFLKVNKLHLRLNGPVQPPLIHRNGISTSPVIDMPQIPKNYYWQSTTLHFITTIIHKITCHQLRNRVYTYSITDKSLTLIATILICRLTTAGIINIQCLSISNKNCPLTLLQTIGSKTPMTS